MSTTTAPLDVLAAGRRHDPDRACTVQDGVVRSFREVDERAGRLAGALRAHGVAPGDRVALLAFNEPEFFELQVGCQRAGAVFVPLNFRLAAAELTALVEDCAPALLVHGPGFAEAAAALGVPAVWHLGEEGAGAGYEQELAAAAPLEATLDPGAAAHILYTSGTTGRAKGAVVSNAALTTRVTAMMAGIDASADDVFLQAGPLFHLTATISLGMLAAGATHVSTRSFDPGRWLDLVAEHGVTKAFAVPTMLAALADAAEERATAPALDSLAFVLYGASPMTARILEAARRALGCDFRQMYGMTETGAATLLGTAEHRADAPDHLRASAGRPLDGFAVRVCDPGGRPVAAGETGEICVRSTAVMDGYWGLPEASAETIQDGWLHTGDAGHVDADGYLFLTDRIKDMVITGGENVYCREVELALGQHPAVADAAVIGVPDDHWGQRVHAVVVPAAGAGLDADALDAWCRERIAPYKRPRSYEAVAALPRNAMGKVLKHVLREERA